MLLTLLLNSTLSYVAIQRYVPNREQLILSTTLSNNSLRYQGVQSGTRISGKRLRLEATQQPSLLETEQSTYQEINHNRNTLAQELLDMATKVGQVGSKASEEKRQSLVYLASKLIPLSDASPARKILEGSHQLIYSASSGGSSGAVGPFVGKVEQRFKNEKEFFNVVMFPGVEIQLLAERSIMDDTRIKVKFVETTLSLFGVNVKKFPVKGVGVWKQLFVGEVNVVLPGKENEEPRRTLLRVMEAPSLFIIIKDLN